MKNFLFLIFLIILALIVYYNWDYTKSLLDKAKGKVESCEVKQHYKKGKAWVRDKLADDEEDLEP